MLYQIKEQLRSKTGNTLASLLFLAYVYFF